LDVDSGGVTWHGELPHEIPTIQTGQRRDARSPRVGIRSAGVYSNHARYLLQYTHPLNSDTIAPGTYFIRAFNEIFVDFDAGVLYAHNFGFREE
jgi:hypothetical protein